MAGNARGQRPIESVMTPVPRSIGVGLPIAAAKELMVQEGIRHLPVLRGGQLCGILSERDVALLEAIEGLDESERVVEEAMTSEVYAVPRDAKIADVARHMAEQKLGSVVVLDGRAVIGIVTTTDLARLLASLLGAYADLSPAEVRSRILAEHHRLSTLLAEVESLAIAVEGGDHGASRRLLVAGRELYGFLMSHLALEDQILLPALRETPGFGAVRADALDEEHQQQREVFRVLIQRSAEISELELARRYLGLIRDLREDMAHEESEFLNPQLLRDDIMPSDTFGG